MESGRRIERDDFLVKKVEKKQAKKPAKKKNLVVKTVENLKKVLVKNKKK